MRRCMSGDNKVINEISLCVFMVAGGYFSVSPFWNRRDC